MTQEFDPVHDLFDRVFIVVIDALLPFNLYRNRIANVREEQPETVNWR